MESYYEKPVLAVNNLISVLNKGNDRLIAAVNLFEDQDVKKLINKVIDKQLYFIECLKKENQKYNTEVKADRVTAENNFEISINDLKIKDENETNSVLNYCEKLVYNIQMEFADTISAEIPGETKDVITKIYNEIRDFHDQFKVLIEREKKSKN